MYILQAESLTKYYPAKAVLKGISVGFRQGRIYAILGENGAGKSTFAHILTGSIPPSGGTLYVKGEKSIFTCPGDAEKAGIGIVHQRPFLAETLTARENIVLGAEPTRLGNFIDKKGVRTQTDTLLQKILAGMTLPLDTDCSRMGADMRFFTAYLAALYRNPSLLILDEPTAGLDIQQRHILMNSIQNLTGQDMAVVIITHNLQEAADYADSIILLENGLIKQQTDNPDRKISSGELERLLRGQQDYILTEQKSPAPNAVFGQDAPVYEVRSLTARPVSGAALFDLSFAAYKGCICLIEGQRETGLQTLEDILTGMADTVCSGSLHIASACSRKNTTIDLSSKRCTPAVLRRCGCVIIPFDRVRRAAHPSLTVTQTAAVYYKGKKPESYAQDMIGKADIHTAPHAPVSSLSGGMLQRLILERELAERPHILIMSEPMQGLDTARSAALAERIRKLALSGCAALILSAEGQFPRSLCRFVFRLQGGKLIPQSGREPL